MQIREYFSDRNRSHWLSQIGKSDWGGGSYLYEMLSNGTFFEFAGKSKLFSKLFLRSILEQNSDFS